MLKNLKPGAGESETPDAGNTESKPQGGAAGQQPPQGGSNQQGEGQGGGNDDPDEAGWDEKTKAYIERLRKENGNHRTKNKELASKLGITEEQFSNVKKALGLDQGSEEKPEDRIKNLEGGLGQVNFRNAVLELALTNEIGAKEIEFFEFLLTKATNELKEGDELSEEAMAEIVQKAKGKSSGTKGGATSVTPGASGKQGTPPPGGANVVTAEQFAKMSTAEKGDLWSKNPDLYRQLTAEARRSNRLV